MIAARQIALIAATALPLLAAAQENLPDSLRFTIRKEYRPVARDAKRITSNPTIDHEPVKKEEMKYDVLPRKAETQVEVQPITSAKLTNEPLEKLTAGHARVGFGNYTMPMVEVGYGTVRNKQYAASGMARYRGSYATLDGRPFGFTDVDISARGSYFLKAHTIHAEAAYAHNRNFFYGYNVADTAFNKTDIVQYFHRGRVRLGIGSTDKLKPHRLYQANFRYTYTADRFKANEHAAGAEVSLAFPIKKELMLANVSGDYFQNNKPSGTRNSGIFVIGPEFRMSRERWALALGINLGLDIYDTATKVLVFPKLDFNYALVKEIWSIYASANGGIKRNGLDALSTANPWMQTDQIFRNSWDRLRFEAGTRGTIIRRLTFDVGISETITGQRAFWVNDQRDGVGNRFILEYHDVLVFGIHGELGYLLNEKLSVAARAEQRFFTMPNDSIQPWHEAPFRFSLHGRYSLKEKLIFKLGLYAMGPRQAKITTVNTEGRVVAQAKELPGYADVSLGAEYRYRKWIGAFVDLRNLAALRYDIYNQYPSQRISVMAGLNFNF